MSEARIKLGSYELNPRNGDGCFSEEVFKNRCSYNIASESLAVYVKSTLTASGAQTRFVRSKSGLMICSLTALLKHADKHDSGVHVLEHEETNP